MKSEQLVGTLGGVVTGRPVVRNRPKTAHQAKAAILDCLVASRRKAFKEVRATGTKWAVKRRR